MTQRRPATRTQDDPRQATSPQQSGQQGPALTITTGPCAGRKAAARSDADILTQRQPQREPLLCMAVLAANAKLWEASGRLRITRLGEASVRWVACAGSARATGLMAAAITTVALASHRHRQSPACPSPASPHRRVVSTTAPRPVTEPLMRTRRWNSTSPRVPRAPSDPRDAPRGLGDAGAFRGGASGRPPSPSVTHLDAADVARIVGLLPIRSSTMQEGTGGMVRDRDASSRPSCPLSKAGAGPQTWGSA